MKKVHLLLIAVLAFASCEESEDEKVTIDKKGTIEVNFTQVNNKDGISTVVTDMNVYSNTGMLVSKIQKVDTIPMLEMVKDTVESNNLDANGDAKDTVISHHKNYQFYITLKPTIDLEKK